MTRPYSRSGVLFACAGALTLAAAGPAGAKVEGDTIVFGAALSLSGKYSTAGQHAQRGYDLAVSKINAAGGVTVAGKTYKIAVKYYDDESTPARGAQLPDRRRRARSCGLSDRRDASVGLGFSGCRRWRPRQDSNLRPAD